MKATELRIGNWINWQRRPVQIKNAVEFYNITTDEINAEPIPLTEEWLVKMGFIDRSINENNFTLSIRDSFVELFAGDYVDGDGHIIDIKYVHQLQNLYFALTGEELKITASQSKS